MTDKQFELLLQQGPLVLLAVLIVGTMCYLAIKHTPAFLCEVQKAVASFASMAQTFSRLTELVNNMDGVLKDFGHTLDKVVELTEKKFEAIDAQLDDVKKTVGEVKDLVSK